MTKLSAIIIAKNAEHTIARALSSVSFADEVVVIIDEQSTDGTEAIAQETRAKIFKRAWQGYGAQKNFGAQCAAGEWLLFVDADEEISEELAKQIRQTIDRPEHDIYWLRVVTYFLGRPLQHLYGHNPRLFKKSAARWTEGLVHEQVERLGVSPNQATIRLGDAHSGILTSPLLHHSHPTIASYLAKMHTYTTLDAQQMARTHTHRSGRLVKPSALLPYHLALRQFIKMYLYRKGILDGYAGLMWCVLSSYYEYEMGKKYLKLV